MSTFDYLNPFYNQTYNLNNLIQNIDSLLPSYDLNVRCIPFCTTENPGRLLQQKAIMMANSIKLQYENEGIYSFKVQYYIKEGARKIENTGILFLLPVKEFENIYIAITIENRYFFKNIMQRIIFDLYPQITTTFLKTNKLKQLLEEFKHKNQINEIKIKHASHKLRISNIENTDKIVSGVSWPDLNITQAFEWINQNNGWFKSLRFEAIRNRNPISVISISRQGFISTTKRFQIVYESLLLPICGILYENFELFKNRGRRGHPNLEVKPLSIHFIKTQFSNTDETKRFIEALQRLDKASVSIIHGNPYINLSIIDYIDGSTYDLWVLNQSDLHIVPQLKSSVFSLKRLINHIFDSYDEGKIQDLKI